MDKSGRKRLHTLMVKLDEREKELIRQKADESGMTMSSYARVVLLADSKKENAE